MLKIALVSWTENVGLTLIRRDLNSMVLRGPENNLLEYDILQVFPFTSETKQFFTVKNVGIRGIQTTSRRRAH